MPNTQTASQTRPEPFGIVTRGSADHAIWGTRREWAIAMGALASSITVGANLIVYDWTSDSLLSQRSDELFLVPTGEGVISGAFVVGNHLPSQIWCGTTTNRTGRGAEAARREFRPARTLDDDDFQDDSPNHVPAALRRFAARGYQRTLKMSPAPRAMRRVL